MTEYQLHEFRRSIMMELVEIKDGILNKMRDRLKESFNIIPVNVRKLPLLSLIDGLERNYSGKSIMIRDNNPSSTDKNTRKRPSVMLQVEDQSFVFDGEALKMVGSGDRDEYKGMVDEINHILKKHMKK